MELAYAELSELVKERIEANFEKMMGCGPKDMQDVLTKESVGRKNKQIWVNFKYDPKTSEIFFFGTSGDIVVEDGYPIGKFNFNFSKDKEFCDLIKVELPVKLENETAVKTMAGTILYYNANYYQISCDQLKRTASYR